MKNDKHKRITITETEGSFTIELTLLMPIIILLFLLILFLNYYLHDRVIINRACYVAALRSANYPEASGREYIASHTLESELEPKLLWRWDYENDIEIHDDQVSVSFEGSMLVNEGLINRYLAGSVFGYETKETSYITDEADYIRRRGD